MKTIAIYLPQFHVVKENSEWWGEGFTDWVTVKDAQSLFEGHRQPRVPLNQNYYNLVEYNIMNWQAKLAKKYSVDGFCFYHYWFKNGKKLLCGYLVQYLNFHQFLSNPCFKSHNKYKMLYIHVWYRHTGILHNAYFGIFMLLSHLSFVCMSSTEFDILLVCKKMKGEKNTFNDYKWLTQTPQEYSILLNKTAH